ncbi:MFS transporter [Rhizosaccharibacter radicis]|uniref:MFS transporter n=1 Tax=Rhizosaccharibacter radicis TaxID=2782605 RepID=A0ABT1VX80_9PROT|nr:MFS transporter [Acetobacteraceae bacterium KSS12]
MAEGQLRAEPSPARAQGAPGPLPSRKRRAAPGFILLTIALDALSFALIIPVVPDLVRSIGHLDSHRASLWVGIVFSAFAAAQFVCAPILGGLSDRFGRRPVLLFSLAALALNALCWVSVPSLGWLLALRLAAGACAGNISAATAYLADVTPPEKRAQAFGLVGAMFGLGFVVGPGLGGLLGGSSLRLPFVVAAVLLALDVLYGLLILPESLPPERRRPFSWRRANPLGTLRLVLADGLTRRLGAAWCCGWMALGAQQAAFILSSQLRFNWSLKQIGLVLAASGLMQAVVQGVLVGRISGRVGPRRTALLGGTCAAAGYGFYALAGRPAVLFAGMPLLALGALTGPAIQAMLSRAAGPQRQGEVQGTLSSLQGLSLVVAPTGMGLLFELATAPGAALHWPGVPFALGALLSLCAAWLVRGVPDAATADVDVAAGDALE